jgi:hypothetical protein
LLHSLNQPLTSLRCSLELSLDEVAERQQVSVSAALQQTEKVIGMIQLMREYLDADQPGPEVIPAALAPAARSVIEELSSIAAVRGVRLLLVGTCAATVPVQESRLLLGEAPAGAVLRVEGERSLREPSATTATLRRVRLAIASRVFETAGASLVFGGIGPTGFVLHIPRRVGASV